MFDAVALQIKNLLPDLEQEVFVYTMLCTNYALRIMHYALNQSFAPWAL